MNRLLTVLALLLALGVTTPVAATFDLDAIAQEDIEPGTAATDAAEAQADDDSAEVVAEPYVPPKVPEDIGEAVGFLPQAIDHHAWPVVVGLILTIIVMVLNKLGLKDKVGAKAVPWVAMGLSVAGTVGASLVAGVSVWIAIVQGVATACSSIGLWELGGKHLFKKKDEDAQTSKP